MFDAALLDLARRQLGVVSRQQCHDLGISTAQLSRARRTGRIVDVTSRTIRLTSAPDTFLSRCWAVDLHVGRRGFLADATAARLHGLRGMPEDPIRIIVPTGHRPRVPDWVAVRSSAWFHPRRDRIQLACGLHLAEPHRMLFGLAARRLPQKWFERAAEDCWHLGLVTPQSAATYLEEHRCRGKDGVATMERWLEKALEQDRPAQSGLELDLLEALERVGLPLPVRQHPVVLRDGRTIHVDIAWPDIRLAVEPGHSWWHGGDEAMTRDLDRKLAAQAVGWDTIQLDETLRNDPALAARRLREAYLARRELLRHRRPA